MSARHWIIGGVMALVAATLGSFGTHAYANHVFNDIPDGSFFANSIESIADAGCAGGFPDGTFRQNDPATRGQFAYWTANCGGRIAWNEQQVSNLGANGTVTISPISMAPGGLDAKTGFIALQANVSVYDPDGLECPCQIAASIRHVNTGDLVGRIARESLDGVVENGGIYASLSTSGRFVATTSGNVDVEKFEVVVTMSDGDNDPVIVGADLTGIYTPFGPFGSDLP